jgi:hypothetical protein
LKYLQRILLFAVCFVVIGGVVQLLAGVFIGASAAHHATDPAKTHELALAAAREFAVRYNLLIWLVSLLVSASIAFRLAGALGGAILAGAVYFMMGKSPPPASSVATTALATPAVLTPAELAAAKHKAIASYPDLGVAGSKLNIEFVARYKRYQQERPEYFRDASWPLHLAEECFQATNSK